jgi:CheY-like chemotaxis protein
MRKKVLVVDDEKDVVTYFSACLEENGYDVLTASDGVEASAKVKSDRPDLVVLDISMPNQSGVRVYRDIKENDELKKIPVLIVTGIQHEFKRFIHTRRVAPPPEGYLEKPVTLQDFISEVKRLAG